MRIPGFTAEASLSKGHQRSYRTGAAGFPAAIQVVPQISPGPITRCGACRADATSPTGYSWVCCTDGDCETRSCTPPPPPQPSPQHCSTNADCPVGQACTPQTT